MEPHGPHLHQRHQYLPEHHQNQELHDNYPSQNQESHPPSYSDITNESIDSRMNSPTTGQQTSRPTNSPTHNLRDPSAPPRPKPRQTRSTTSHNNSSNLHDQSELAAKYEQAIQQVQQLKHDLERSKNETNYQIQYHRQASHRQNCK